MSSRPLKRSVKPLPPPREAAQHGPLAGFHRHDDLGSFTGAQRHAVDVGGRAEQAAVGADDLDRAPVDESEVVAAGVAAVEQPQADPFRRHVDVGIVGAVDEDLVAEHTDVGEEAAGVVELVVAVERPVLDDHRDVVDAVVVGQVQVGGFGVVDDEHAGDAAVDVVGGLAVRVRVVPQRCRGLVDAPRRPPRLARLDRLVWAAVHARRHVHAVPVHRGRLADAVGERDLDVVAAARPQGRAEVGAVDAPRRRRPAGQDRRLPGLHLEVETDDTVIASLTAVELGDAQGVAERQLTDVGDVGARVEPGPEADDCDDERTDHHAGPRDDADPATAAAGDRGRLHIVRRYGRPAAWSMVRSSVHEVGISRRRSGPYRRRTWPGSTARSR